MTTPLDKRLNAFRPDIADIRLKDQVSADHYVSPKSAVVKPHFVDLLDKPDAAAGLQCQVLNGHGVDVFERSGGWAWVQTVGDGYVGYIRDDALEEAEHKSTHMVSAPRTFLYPEPDLKHPRSGYRSMGSKLVVVDTVTNRGTDYAILATGEAVIARHLIRLGNWASDPVAIAELLLHTPYLWGGNTGFGIDCSGLVFLANMVCGKTVLRDSDMQARSIGEEIGHDFSQVQRGDLVFWKGHVGIMADRENLLHANGNTMNVALEKLADAVERIGYLYGQPTMIRRP